MRPQIGVLKKVALDLFFPRWCVGCGKEGEYICDNCRQSLTFIEPPVCPRCGRPKSGASCPGCIGEKSEIDGIRSPFLFNGVIRQAIHEFKYRNLKALAPLLAGLLHDYLSENPMPGELLVPVPLHSKRLNERGYNQGALLANELGRLTGLPVAGKYLVRQIYTPSQAKSAGVSERRVNVTGAFACHDGSVRNKRIIVVDDVSTSGATLNACAAALKQAGAAEVWGLVTALEL